MAWQHLVVEREHGVERVFLNRPAVRNAFNEAMIAELTEWAEALARDTGVRAVVLAGAGPAFCAGADLTWMVRTATFTYDENLADARRASRMFDAIDRLPMAVIGRVHGAAFGGGAGLAAVCDVVVAEDSALFGFTEVKLGIVPAVISPYVLAKIGRSAARELFLTGRRFSAQHAQEVGLVHAVVPSAQLDATIDDVLREVLAAGPQAVAAAKRLIRDVLRVSADDVADVTAQALAQRRASDEGREGIQAFLDKRKPAWSGS